MKVFSTGLADLFVIEPTVFKDERGSFHENFNARQFNQLIGRELQFVQENYSFSTRHVIRGLHYQLPRAQGKLVQAIGGTIFDVAVDLRRHSATFGQWLGVELSSENRRQLWIPEGFAHGFLAKSERAEVLYKLTDYWLPEDERCIAWNDPILAIEWPLSASPVLSMKDAEGIPFANATPFT